MIILRKTLLKFKKIIKIIGGARHLHFLLKGEIIYGILLGLSTSIISIFNVELSMVIGIIIVTLFTNIIDMYSFKLRYNKKFYNILLSIFLVLILIDIPILIHIMK